MYKKVIITSDNHGYLELTQRILREEGLIDGNNNWIAGPDVQLCQLGDTVSRGPDSIGTFNFFRDLQRSLPEGQVIRLMGNHEFNYCGGPAFSGYSEPQGHRNVHETLRPLMEEDGKSGDLRFAHYLVDGYDNDWLLVHGGLMHTWYPYLPSLDAKSVSSYLNDLGIKYFNGWEKHWRYDLRKHTDEWKADKEKREAEFTLLTGISYSRGGWDEKPGVVWADFEEELVPYEDEHRLHQIVGHRSHEKITRSPNDKFIDVNVHYGYAQLLRFDTESGLFTMSNILKA